MVESQPPGRRGKAPRDATTDTPGKGPEEFFRAGIALLRRKQFQDALRAFKHALDLDPEDARYLSFYGLCLAATGRNPGEGVQLCEAAAEKEFYRPELHLNLGRAHLIQGRPEKAQKAFREGLALDEQNREIIRELENMGVRKRPTLPFLNRKNPLNKWSGLVRQRLAHKARV